MYKMFLWIICALLVTSLLLFWYLTRNFNYFTKRGICGPKPVVGIGNLWELMYTPVAELEVQRYRKYGKIYGVFEGNRPVLKVGDPALVKEIFQRESDVFQSRRDVSNARHPIVDLIVTLRGDEWRRMRSTTSPNTGQQLRAKCSEVLQSLHKFMAALDARTKAPNSDNTLDMKAWFECYAIDVLARTLFGTDTNAYTDPNDPFLVNARRLFRPPLWKIWSTLLVPTRVLNVLHITTETNDRAVDFFYDFTRTQLRQREGRQKSDDGGGARPAGLSDREIMSQLFASLTGGYEGGANVMAFCCHELALNPLIQDRLHREVTEALPALNLSLDSGLDYDYELLLKLPFLDACVAETMRRHSLSLRPSRVPDRDFPLGETGVTLERGLIVEIAAYAMQRSDEYFPSADQFIPDRFLPANVSQIPEYSNLPYGGGPRGCVGQKFSQLYIKLAIAYAVRHFRFALCERTQLPVPLRMYIRLQVADTVYLAVEPRE